MSVHTVASLGELGKDMMCAISAYLNEYDRQSLRATTKAAYEDMRHLVYFRLTKEWSEKYVLDGLFRWDVNSRICAPSSQLNLDIPFYCNVFTNMYSLRFSSAYYDMTTPILHVLREVHTVNIRLQMSVKRKASRGLRAYYHLKRLIYYI